MNILQVATKIYKEAHKQASKRPDDQYKETYDHEINLKLNAIREHAKLAKQIKDILTEEGLMGKEPEKLKDNNYWWITLRPNVGKFKDFKNNFELTYLPTMNFDKYMYCYEQKGETKETLGMGFHVHLLAHLPDYTQKKDLLRKSKSQWAKYFGSKKGDNIPEAFIDIDKVHTTEHLNNLFKYMEGDKAEKQKAFACEQDPIWRNQEKLENIYTKGFKESQSDS